MIFYQQIIIMSKVINASITSCTNSISGSFWDEKRREMWSKVSPSVAPGFPLNHKSLETLGFQGFVLVATSGIEPPASWMPFSGVGFRWIFCVVSSPLRPLFMNYYFFWVYVNALCIFVILVFILVRRFRKFSGSANQIFTHTKGKKNELYFSSGSGPKMVRSWPHGTSIL